MSLTSKHSAVSRKINRVKIIPWYFYPEFADKSLFKSRAAQMELDVVLKDLAKPDKYSTVVEGTREAIQLQHIAN